MKHSDTSLKRVVKQIASESFLESFAFEVGSWSSGVKLNGRIWKQQKISAAAARTDEFHTETRKTGEG